MNAFLNRQVRLLVARYGREQVMEALSNAGEAELPQRRTAPVARTRPKSPPAKRPKMSRKSALEVVAAARVDPEVRPVIERIAVAYEAREILPEPWRVKDLLRSEGLDPRRVRSRADALPKVVSVLAKKAPERLEILLSRWRKHAEQGDLAMFAEAILGPPETASPAGSR